MTTLTVDERRERVYHNEMIQKIVKHAPSVRFILEQATTTGGMDLRWARYDLLKHEAEKYVGWTSNNPHLMDSHYHDALCWALDVLLPHDDAFDANKDLKIIDDED